MRWPLLLAFILVGGCSEGGTTGSASVADPGRVPPGGTPAQPLAHSSFAEGTFMLAPPTHEFRLDVTVPNGTIKVLLNLTLTDGAASDLLIQFGSCTQRIGAPVAGNGRELNFDCGPQTDGTQTLYLTATAGQLGGTYSVVGLMCGTGPHARSNCYQAR